MSENLSGDQLLRERNRDRFHVDSLHARMMDRHELLESAARDYNSALRAYEERWGKDDKA